MTFTYVLPMAVGILLIYWYRKASASGVSSLPTIK